METGSRSECFLAEVTFASQTPEVACNYPSQFVV